MLGHDLRVEGPGPVPGHGQIDSPRLAQHRLAELPLRELPDPAPAGSLLLGFSDDVDVAGVSLTPGTWPKGIAHGSGIALWGSIDRRPRRT